MIYQICLKQRWEGMLLLLGSTAQSYFMVLRVSYSFFSYTRDFLFLPPSSSFSLSPSPLSLYHKFQKNTLAMLTSPPPSLFGSWQSFKTQAMFLYAISCVRAHFNTSKPTQSWPTQQILGNPPARRC